MDEITMVHIILILEWYGLTGYNRTHTFNLHFNTQILQFLPHIYKMVMMIHDMTMIAVINHTMLFIARHN